MDIIDYPNYLIYDDGRVYSKKRNIFIKQTLNRHGYYKVDLYKNGKGKTFLIHRLIALHYIPKIEGKYMIDHIDRDKSNNHINNLRWVNRSENGINSGVSKNKKLNHKHIYETKFNTYEFSIRRQNIKHSKTFKTLEECIEYRDNYLNSN